MAKNSVNDLLAEDPEFKEFKLYLDDRSCLPHA